MLHRPTRLKLADFKNFATARQESVLNLYKPPVILSIFYAVILTPESGTLKS
jgi:hypothetical protein